MLWRTLESCVQASLGLQFEIVIADDASWDGSIDETKKRFPEIRVVRHEERKGASPTKDLGARHARGEVLVFLDSHTKPESGALERLVEDVELLHGASIVTPAIGRLDPERWRIVDREHLGHGYAMDLESLDPRWLPLCELREQAHRSRKFYETPALIGCAFAIHRDLYEDLHGFDPHMLSWGAEDLDLGLKSWLMGHPVLHDPDSVVGHRFQSKFENFHVPVEQLVANQLRLARKNLTDSVWSDWVDRCRGRYPGKLTDHPEGLWARAWKLFTELRPSVENERSYLFARRVHDEFWYSTRFGLPWPRLHQDDALIAPSFPVAIQAEAASAPEPSPSPSDFGHHLDARDDTFTLDSSGEASGNVITAENADSEDGHDTYDGVPIVDTASYVTTLLEAPQHGLVTLDEHGQFTYTAYEGSTESDSFTYELVSPDGLTDQATVNVLWADTSDHEPQFADDYFVEIPEDTEVESEIIAVEATDPDDDPLTYSLIGGNTDFTFDIDDTTGVIRLVQPLDHEIVARYTLTVKAMDSEGLSGTTNVNITITDVNEPPIVPTETYTVDDGATADDFVGTITAIDPEGEPINSYAILEQKGIDGAGVEHVIGAFFRIEKDSDSDTASIYVAEGITIDYDEYHSFQLKVQAYVIGGQFGDEWQIIKVRPSSNTPPIIDGVDVFDLYDDSEIGDMAAVIYAHDYEDGPEVKFEFVPDTEYGPFLLDRDTGEIVVDGQLDSATTPSYELHVRVFDSQFAFVDTMLILNVLAAARPAVKVGMVVDNVAIEGDVDGFKIRFCRFGGNNDAPLEVRFKGYWKASNPKFRDATIDNLNLTMDERTVFTEQKALILATQSECELEFYAKRDPARDKRPKQFFIKLLPTEQYSVISSAHGQLLDENDSQQLSAYASSAFTIYKGKVLWCPPVDNPANEGDLHWNDVQQGFFNCYFMAAMIAVVRESQFRIKILFNPKVPDANGNYKIRFPGDPAHQTLLVSSDLDRGPDQASLNRADVNRNGLVEIWMVLLERGLALLEGDNLVENWLGVRGGSAVEAYELLTGQVLNQGSDWIDLGNEDWKDPSADLLLGRIKSHLNNGKQVLMSTVGSGTVRPWDNFWFQHVYVVTDVTANKTKITVIDPLSATEFSVDIGPWFSKSHILRITFCPGPP